MASTNAIELPAPATETPSAEQAAPATIEPARGGQAEGALTPVAPEQAETFLERLPALLKLASRGAALPFGFLLIVFLFLIVQDRIDRSDPKLALAPVYPERDLPFDPQPPHRRAQHD